MTISVANFITQYLRPALASATDWPDATLGYWIDAALLDISRSFPRKGYATWNATTGQHIYAYADSLTTSDETTIIRILTCVYPFTLASMDGPLLVRKSHLDPDFIGQDCYDPDNNSQNLYIGSSVATGQLIYCDTHAYWKTVTTNITNPSEHYELIRLFCIWHAFLHQAADTATSAVPNPSLLNSLALEARRAEIAYRAAYDKLNESKASSGITQGWSMDKWDRNRSGESSLPGVVPPSPDTW